MRNFLTHHLRHRPGFGGYAIERIEELTKIDPWFIERMKNIVDYKHSFLRIRLLEDILPEVLREAKVLGFSDFQIVLRIEDQRYQHGEGGAGCSCPAQEADIFSCKAHPYCGKRAS